jgi:hypothetical protein
VRYDVPHAERCRSMVMSRTRPGERCTNRAALDGLCRFHIRKGAVTPDDWTQPDNLPIFYVNKAS